MATHRNGYSGLQIGLHWLVMVMVVIQIVIGENMTEMVEAIEEGEAVSAGDAFWGSVHFWLGLGILAAMAFRLAVRLRTGVPAHAPGSSPLQNLAASVLHWAFYVVLLSVPISGLVAYYGLADVGEIHGLSKPLLIVLVAIHAGAALYNQFVRKDGTLTRMLRPQA
ncbi:cytochrome b [Devosia sp.]|uniref:cytochrome b n=1 Tax=Devosia sp. TaxID=1871048 RepID=UPI0037C014C6